MTLEDLKSEIISSFSTLAPKIDPNKAMLEFNPIAHEVAELLGDPLGLSVIEYINEEFINHRSPFLLTDFFPDKCDIERLIEHFWDKNNLKNLKILLHLYSQFWEKSGSENDKPFFDELTKFGTSKAIISKKSVLKVCSSCYSEISDININPCCQSFQNILEVYELSIDDMVKAVLQYNQHLEIYVKNRLQKNGISCIGWAEKPFNKDVCTSITYQIDGEPVEIDNIGVTTPLAILLIEAKTSKNIQMNEFRKTRDKFDRLIAKINEINMNHKFTFLKIFITTGQLDINLSLDSYKRQGWDFIDRQKIVDIDREFRRIQNSL